MLGVVCGLIGEDVVHMIESFCFFIFIFVQLLVYCFVYGKVIYVGELLVVILVISCYLVEDVIEKI